MWLSADNAAKGPIIANRPELRDWEKFIFHWKDDSTVEIRSLVSGKKICKDWRAHNVVLSSECDDDIQVL